MPSDNMFQDPKQILIKLKNSKFRSSFHLTSKEKIYLQSKGMPKIKEHAYDFIKKRLAPELIFNDGKQTPMHGHPVFVAEHATATCCRGCLNKWYQIPKNKPLNDQEITFIVNIIMEWLNQEMM